MRPSALVYMYRRRLRVHGVQELFAAIGIAIAVALVFAAIVAERSISSSAGQVVHAVVGPSNLQLRARDGDGFSEAFLTRVQHLPGVKQAAPLLEQTASIVSPDGRRTTVDLAGADLRLAVLDGLAETLPIGALSPSGGVGLSRTSADALGIARSPRHGQRPEVTLQLRGRSKRLRVSAVLGHEAAGALSDALVAVMPLRRMQQIAGLQGRITRVLVQSEPGRETAVQAELKRLAGGHLEVASAEQDVALLKEALGPSDLASGLFAAIGALVGFLLAFNAMLLTVADRRKAIADLRIAGAKRATIVEMVLFEALCLGIVASLVGLVLGYILSVGVFHQSTKYLAEAFTLSSSTVVSTRAVLVSFFGGVLAACLASTVPLLDLRSGRARDSIYQEEGAPGNALNRGSQRRLFWGALCLVAAATALLVFAPAAAIPATALLGIATVLAVPLAFAAMLRAAGSAADRWQQISILPIALASLKATTVRSLALAATGAVALFGSVALGGSRQNLLQGIGSFARGYVADADIWVANPGDNQAVNDFPADGYPARRRPPVWCRFGSHLPGWLSAARPQARLDNRPSARRQPARTRKRDPRRKSRRRDYASGRRRLDCAVAEDRRRTSRRRGRHDRAAEPYGTAPLQDRRDHDQPCLAARRDLHEHRRLPSHLGHRKPHGVGCRPSPGGKPMATKHAIEEALGHSSGLEVSLAGARAARIDALASEGLGQLEEISTLLLIAATLAMIAALGSSIWQRRPALAGLRLFGATPYSLQGILLLEALLMLGAGCLTGALAGVYGQVVIDGFLRHVTGFPLASPAASARPIEIFALVLLTAIAVGAIPSWMAARVRPALALESE